MFLLHKFLLFVLHTLRVINRPLLISFNDCCPSAINCSCPLRVDELISNYSSTSVDSTTIIETKSTIISSTTEYYSDNSSPDELMLGDDSNISSPIETTVDSTTLPNAFKMSTRGMIYNRNSFMEVPDEASNDTARSLKTVETFQSTTPRLKSPSRTNRIDDTKRIADAILNFSMVYSSLMFKHHGNVVTSPTSIALLILLTSYGACPSTQRVINIVPNLPNATRCNLMFIESFIKQNTTIRTNGMLISHKIFMPDNIELSGKFMKIAQQVFKLNPQYINFNNSVESAEIINNWSANQTDNNIADVVNSHQFNDETDLVIISVAYFNCDWLIPFDPKRTKQMEFSVNGVNKKVWTMNQDIKCYYGILQTLDASPYVELLLNATTDRGPMRMIIILPSEWTNLSNIVSKLSEFQLKDLYRNAYKDIVNISLPKFKIKSKIDLKDHQTAMRTEILFSNDASFKRITKSRYIKVSDFIQMSIIDVNEGSHQFDHLTNGLINKQHLSTTRTHFHVNRPFIVLIANNDRIFASAQVTDPTY